MTDQKITAIMIVEIAGRPGKHVKETLDTHIDQIKKLKDVMLINKTLSEPKIVDKEKEIYTCFAEVEFETNNMKRVIDLVFDFMPSSIEIIEPAEVKLDLQETTSFLNDLTGRLHRYDEIAKVAQLQTQQLKNQLKQVNDKLVQKESKKKKSPKKPKKKKS